MQYNIFYLEVPITYPVGGTFLGKELMIIVRYNDDPHACMHALIGRSHHINYK